MQLFGSVQIRIRIELKCWIRIQVNPDLQPCRQVSRCILCPEYL
jgi:hypothetical protein